MIYKKNRRLKFFNKKPLEFISGFLYRTILGPLKYSRGDDYDAETYWRNRFSKYHLSLKGAGNVGLSEKENETMYANSAEVFIDLCRRAGVNFARAATLEIGCGTGFYTQLLYDSGVKHYLGLDITDVLFPKLSEKFPQFRFIKKDITKAIIKGNFDLILMINVIEHIVTDTKFAFAMDNIKNCLANNGIFVVGAVMARSKKHLFYVRYWTLEDIKQQLPKCILEESVPFQNGQIASIRKTYD